MGALEDYIRQGGLAGLAQRELQKAITDAMQNPQHEFRPVVDPLSRFSLNRAAHRLYKILQKALSSETSEYGLSALAFLQLPTARFAIDHAWEYLEQHGWNGPAENEDLEDVWNRFIEMKKKDAASRMSAGASAGGKKVAALKRALNAKRDQFIRNSKLPIDILAKRKGLSPRRVRQIVNSK